MRGKTFLITIAAVFHGSLSFGQETINDLLNIYPPGWGNSHIPYSTGDVYLTGFTGTGGGAFTYRTYDGSGYVNQFKISADGNIGIGTTTPTERLHIVGGNLLVNSGSQSIRSELHASSDYARFMFNGSDNFIISYGVNHATHRHQLALKANNSTEGSIGLYTSGAERMRIATNGNIGIGTTTPNSLLTIGNSGDIEFSTVISGTTSGNYRVPLKLYRPSDAGSNHIQRWHSNVGGTDAEVARLTADGTLLVGLGGGNVGIGITNPTHKLTVDGVISAREVKVSNTPNSDYVFEPDYPLLPLSEVETHIKEKKHLPGIPSAEEFKQNGVGLGEMDDMLLRKVEELVLYTIEQQKELEELKKENEELRRENEKQNIEIEKLKEK